MGPGPYPTLIGPSAVLVLVLIGITKPRRACPWLVERSRLTYAVLPFGVIAMLLRPLPTLIGLSMVLVAVRIGITELA